MFGFGNSSKKNKEVKLPGSATFKDGEWRVTMGPEFIEQMKELPPEVKNEITELIKGIEAGTVNPLTMGKRMCGYCGDPVKDFNELNEEEAPNMCKECRKKLI
jgi:hypothetical protein